MEIIKIDSKKNKNLTFLRKIKGDNKFLKENNLFIIDDYLTFLEFLKKDKLTNISYKVLKIFTYDYKIVDFIENWVKDYKKDYKQLGLRVYLANKEVLRDIFKLDNLKITALVSYELKKNIIDLNDIKSDKLNYVIVLDGIENPGNLGSIFRNSLAFGFNNLVLVNLKTSPFNSLSLRASKGALFYLNLYFVNEYSNFLDFIYQTLRNINIDKKEVGFILAQNEVDSISIHNLNKISDFLKRYKLVFIVFGNEESGISKSLKEIIFSEFDFINVKIEIDIDSINVSCANAIFNFVFKYLFFK